MKRMLKICIFCCLVCLIFFAGLYLLRNPVISHIAETSATKANGAKVDISGLNLDLFHSSISVANIAITNPAAPMTNRLEAGPLNLDIELMPLLKREVIISKMMVSNIAVQTARNSSGAISETPAQKSGESLTDALISSAKKAALNEINNMPVMQWAAIRNLSDLNTVAKNLKLQSPDKIKALRSESETKRRQWEKIFSGEDLGRRIKTYQKDAEALGKKIKDVGDILARIQKAEKLKNNIDIEIKKIRADAGQLKKDLSWMQTQLKEVPAWIEADYNRALDELNLKDPSIDGITRALLGPKIGNIMITGVSMLGKLRDGMNAGETDSGTGAPQKGKTPLFVWVQHMEASGVLPHGVVFSASGRNLSNQSQRMGKPADVDIDLSQKGRFDGKLSAYIDYRKPGNPMENFKFHTKNVVLDNLSLFQPGGPVPSTLLKGTGSVSASLSARKDMISGNALFYATGLLFDKSQSPDFGDKTVNELVQGMTESIKNINGETTWKQSGGRLNWNISSNLDEIAADNINRIVEDKVSAAKMNLKKQISASVADDQKALSAESNLLDKELNKYIEELDQILPELKGLTNLIPIQ